MRDASPLNYVSATISATPTLIGSLSGVTINTGIGILTITNQSETLKAYVAYATSAPANVAAMDVLWPQQSIRFNWRSDDVSKLYLAGEGSQTVGIWQEAR